MRNWICEWGMRRLGKLLCCGNARGMQHFRPLSHFANIQSCNSKFWAILLFATLSNLKNIGLDNFLKWQVQMSNWLDLLPLKLCGKEGHPQRPQLQHGRRNHASNIPPRCHIHWAMTAPYNFLVVTAPRVQTRSRLPGKVPLSRTFPRQSHSVDARQDFSQWSDQTCWVRGGESDLGLVIGIAQLFSSNVRMREMWWH